MKDQKKQPSKVVVKHQQVVEPKRFKGPTASSAESSNPASKKAKAQTPPQSVGKARPDFKKVDKWIKIVVPIVFVLFTSLLTFGQNRLLLFKMQDLDIFMFSSQFWADCMQKPGGLSLYLASFLNQFFFLPWLGTILFMGSQLLVIVLTSKAFSLKGKAFPFVFIPSLLLLLTITELGYTIYTLKVDGYTFLPTLGIVFALVSLILFKRIQKARYRFIFLGLYMLIAYPISGAYALFGGLLLLLHLVKTVDQRHWLKSWAPLLLLLTSTIAVPYLYYLFVYPSIYIKECWFINMPDFFFYGPEKVLWLPYLGLLLFYISVAVFWNAKIKPKRQFTQTFAPILLFLLTLILVQSYSFRDKNFNTELGMLSATEKSDWRKVLQLSCENADEPTRLMVMNTHLALQKLRIAGDSLYFYKDGDKKVRYHYPVLPIQLAGKLFYYQYGKLNYSYKWCMEEMVKYGLSVAVLKQFVLSSILNGEYGVAKKYNEFLKSTLFYHSWAMKQQKYMDNPREIAKNQDFKNILTLTTYGNVLEMDYNQLENYLTYSYALLEEGTPEMIELSIQRNLDLKDIDRFWPRFFQYAKIVDRLPVHFQEAALIFQYLDKKVDISKVKFSPDVLNRFQFMINSSLRYQGCSEASMHEFFKNEFAGTYWYYYYFNNNHSYERKKSGT